MSHIKPAIVPVVSDQEIETFHRQGFLHLKNLLTLEEAAHYRVAAMDLAGRMGGTPEAGQGRVFIQLVNAWQLDPALKNLTLHAKLHDCVTRLAGMPLRLWHDHLLIKEPHNKRATEFHQDAPYWPHRGSRIAISAWIALNDVPVEQGCMSFIPGSQSHKKIKSLDLLNPQALFDESPELRWEPRVTVPLRCGDCTFHMGYTAHMAGPNLTDTARVAHVAIFMDAETRYAKRRDGQPHPVTDSLHLNDGDALDQEIFPRIGQVE